MKKSVEGSFPIFSVLLFVPTRGFSGWALHKPGPVDFACSLEFLSQLLRVQLRSGPVPHVPGEPDVAVEPHVADVVSLSSHDAALVLFVVVAVFEANVSVRLYLDFGPAEERGDDELEW